MPKKETAKPPWEPNFGVYFAELDGSPCSFVVDLHARALRTHPVRLDVRVPLLSPCEDGIREEHGLDSMWKVEDLVVARIEARGGVFVGRVVSGGVTVFFFYLPKSEARTDFAPIVGDLGDYKAKTTLVPDAEWELYHDVLYPDPYSLQTMLDTTLLEQIRESGDMMDTAREIDHLVLFRDEVAAKKAGKELEEADFRVDGVTFVKGEFRLSFHHNSALSGDAPEEWSRTILDVVLPLKGRYDGWGCEMVKASPDQPAKKKPAAAKPAKATKAPSKKN